MYYKFEYQKHEIEFFHANPPATCTRAAFFILSWTFNRMKQAPLWFDDFLIIQYNPYSLVSRKRLTHAYYYYLCAFTGDYITPGVVATGSAYVI